jgi:hypothetical protein
VFQAGYSAQVTGLMLADGRGVVIKVRPWQDRLVGCTAAQRALFAAGYPAPEPIIGPLRDQSVAVSAEVLVGGGSQLGSDQGQAAAFASALAALVRHAPGTQVVGSLSPSPPWVGWDWPDERLWPPPDDRTGDLNQFEPGDWLDQLARTVKQRLAAHAAPAVIGHGDFYSQNIHWRNGELLAVHDWDSVVAQPEAAIAGQAAAIWPATGAPGQVATVEQTDAFLDAYAVARGRPWTTEETEVAWAAGLWVRAFDTKKAMMSGDAAGLVLNLESAEVRRKRAGL